MEVPTTTQLVDIYSQDSLTFQMQRWDNLLQQFESKYGKKAEFVSRSPGRVNLIGEHIDYSLYEVLPMALEVDVLQAVAVIKDQQQIRICNVNPDKFADNEFDVPTQGDIEIDSSSFEWSNYFRAGLRGAVQLLRKKRGDAFVPVGMDVLVDGTVPSGGGLSSSAAFVCASALAVLKANGEDHVDQKELVELAIVSERAVGVYSGGMDQSASVFPLRGRALYVSFVPSLSAENITFPETDPELTFVVAQSFVAADKHVTAPTCYNLRVVEVSMAAAMLAKIFRLEKPLPEDAGPLGISLRGFHDAFFEQTDEGIKDNHSTGVDDFSTQLGKLIEMVDAYVTQEEGYTREELGMILGLSVEEVEKRFMSKFEVRADRFMLRQRALHVFNEALRVIKFRQLLKSPPEGDGKALLQALGGLMNETQDSCRDVYDNSCPELDELCSLARSAGAVGSRLTGAGWGGCTVHLMPKDKVDKVKEVWEDKYYRKKFPDISQEKLDQAVVVSKPGCGSCLYTVT